jgi:hypothetical protein
MGTDIERDQQEEVYKRKIFLWFEKACTKSKADYSADSSGANTTVLLALVLPAEQTARFRC